MWCDGVRIHGEVALILPVGAIQEGMIGMSLTFFDLGLDSD